LSVVPAALFLMDFSGSERGEELLDELAGDEAVTLPEFATDPVDEAYVRGVEDGKAAVEADIVARLEEQKATFEQDLAASRQSWCLAEGARIARQLLTAMGDMEGRIAESTVRVLRPFLGEAIRVQATVELRSILHDLVTKTPGIALEISGPEDLLAAIRESLADSVATVSYVANEARDVQVKAGASILETRIAAWLGQIEGPRL
jgi:hypothetical protein